MIAPGYNDGMDAEESTRRSWFDLRAAVILGFLALVACFVAWKWWESVARERCLSDLADKGALFDREDDKRRWSWEWPFYNVQTTTEVDLNAGQFNDDDVRLVRRMFPGAWITQVTMTQSPVGCTFTGEHLEVVEFPEGMR